MQRRMVPSFVLTSIVRLAKGEIEGSIAPILCNLSTSDLSTDLFVRYPAKTLTHYTVVADVNLVVH